MKHPRRNAMSFSVLLASIVLAGCGGDASNDDASAQDPSLPPAVVSLAELRDATACPIAPNDSDLPEGVVLGPGDASVTEYDGEGVTVDCDFPVDPPTPSDEVTAIIVAAPEGTDVLTMETDSGGSWRNTIYNTTGVEKDKLASAVKDLEGDDVEVLEGNGESVAVRNIAVEDADRGLLLVYGDDAWSGDQLEAIAVALREAPAPEEDAGE